MSRATPRIPEYGKFLTCKYFLLSGDTADFHGNKQLDDQIVFDAIDALRSGRYYIDGFDVSGKLVVPLREAVIEWDEDGEYPTHYKLNK